MADAASTSTEAQIQMKLNGRAACANVVTIVFPREGQADLVFRAAAIMEGEEFTKLVPEPQPPSIRKPGEEVAVLDFKDIKYQKALSRRGRLQTYWIILKSLAATPGLEWDKLQLEDPETWELLDEEMKDFGLSAIEKSKLIQACFRANSMDEAFIEAAKLRFMSSQQPVEAPTVTSSQVVELSNTKSGALASI